MTRRRLLLAIVGVVVLVAATLASVTWVFHGSGNRHHYLDGQGPLASVGDYTSEGNGLLPTDPGPWTMGYRLCLRAGDTPVTIDAVTPTKTVGNGYRELGTLLRTFTVDPARDTPIIGVTGYPPVLPQGSQSPDPLVNAIGAQVKTPCSDSRHYTELLLGWAHGPGTDGGGWLGIDVTYTLGKHQHTVSLAYDLLICGPAARSAAPQAC